MLHSILWEKKPKFLRLGESHLLPLPAESLMKIVWLKSSSQVARITEQNFALFFLQKVHKMQFNPKQPGKGLLAKP